jgi:hypothetical protein
LKKAGTEDTLLQVRCHRNIVKSKTPVAMAVLIGIAHFLIVGIPFLQAQGGGEGLMYIVFVDFPLYWVANVCAPRLMYNSVAFNFWLSPILGTIMYAAFGYSVGSLLVLVKRKLKI